MLILFVIYFTDIMLCTYNNNNNSLCEYTLNILKNILFLYVILILQFYLNCVVAYSPMSYLLDL
jgi:hypothetical protein